MIEVKNSGQAHVTILVSQKRMPTILQSADDTSACKNT